MDIFDGLKDFEMPPCPEDCILPSNYTFNSEYQRQIARENALKRNANQKGGDNRNAKTWQIEYIDGRIEIVKSIHSWIVGKNYSKSGIYNMRAGKWKRYKDIKSISIIVSNPETVL